MAGEGSSPMVRSARGLAFRRLVLGCFLLGGCLLVRPTLRAEQPASGLAALLKAEEDRQARLAERYLANHPKLQEQTLRVAELRRLAAAGSNEPLPLQLARVEFAVELARYLENHPVLIEQAARVSAMEREWQRDPAIPDVLLEAEGDLAAMDIRYGEANPRYIAQRQKVAALQHELTESSPASYELRLARATQEYSAERYGPNHPKMQALARQIARLESGAPGAAR